jgi:hypothetical protein
MRAKMAESGLSIGLPELIQEVGFFLDYGRGIVKPHTAGQLSEIMSVIQSGIRRVYYPVPASPAAVGHEWSWLRPTTSITLQQVISGALTRGSFTAGDLITQTTTLAVATYVSDNGTEMTLYGVSGVADGTSTWYPTDDDDDTTNAWTPTEIADTSKYDLPDDLGRIVGSLNYSENKYRESITVVSIAAILEMRALNAFTSNPRYAAIRYKASDGSGGQRQEILFFPQPDQAYVLLYEYEAYNGALSDSFPYPLGGMQLAELYIESCLAVAESRLNDEIGNHTSQYQALLIDAIARDRKRDPRSYGQMGHVEDTYDRRRRYGAAYENYPITINGVVY